LSVESRGAILVAGLRRFALLLLGIAAVTTVVSLLLALLTGWNPDRAVAVGFDLVGVFFLVAGFFVGNRGPVRLKGQASALLFGERHVRWATDAEREESISDSAIFIVLGVVMIAIGIAVDSRYRLF
jgi:hypothetical protein